MQLWRYMTFSVFSLFHRIILYSLYLQFEVGQTIKCRLMCVFSSSAFWFRLITCFFLFFLFFVCLFCCHYLLLFIDKLINLMCVWKDIFLYWKLRGKNQILFFFIATAYKNINVETCTCKKRKNKTK